jgi:hypothetical protein
MLAIHAALCGSTGSLEMLVFQTLSAGNRGHLAAPGTFGPAGAEAEAGGPPAKAAAGAEARGGAGAAAWAGAGAETAGLPARAAAVSATPQATAEVAKMARRANERAANCPVSMPTVASWHGRQLSAR